jgi:hypothetical protein
MPQRQSNQAFLADIAAQLTPKRRQGRQGERLRIAIERGFLPSVGRVFRIRPGWILSHLSDAQIQTACHVLWVAAQRYLEAEGWSFDQVQVIRINPNGSVELDFTKLTGTRADITIGELLQRYGYEPTESAFLS